MNEVVSYLPEIVTGAAGYVVSQAAAIVALRHAVETDEAARQFWSGKKGDAGEGQQSSEAQQSNIRNIARLGALSLKRGMGAGALGIVAGSSALLAWAPNLAPQPDQNPGLEIVVDHAYEASQNGSDQDMSRLVQQLDASHAFKLKIIDAHNDHADKAVSLDVLSKEQSYGQPIVDQGVDAALATESSNLALSSTIATSKNNVRQHDAGILVMTNGQEIGDPTKVTFSAQQDNLTPISIINFKPQSGKVSSDLAKIASGTRGNYWTFDTNRKEGNVTAANVVSVLSGNSGESSVITNFQDWMRVINVTSGLGLVAWVVNEAGVVYRPRGKQRKGK